MQVGEDFPGKAGDSSDVPCSKSSSPMKSKNQLRNSHRDWYVRRGHFTLLADCVVDNLNGPIDSEQALYLQGS